MSLTRCFVGVLFAALTAGNARANPGARAQVTDATWESLETVATGSIVRLVFKNECQVQGRLVQARRDAVLLQENDTGRTGTRPACAPLRDRSTFLRGDIVRVAVVGETVPSHASETVTSDTAPEPDLAPAAPLGELRGRITPNETITVTDVNGRKTRGRIGQLSDSSLELLVGEESGTSTPPGSITRQADNIRTIRKEDRVWNGMVIGAGVGLGAAVAVPFALIGSDGYPGRSWYVSAMAIPLCGIGAGVGAVVDKIHHNERLYFDRGRNRASKLRVAPLVTAHRRGMLVSCSPR